MDNTTNLQLNKYNATEDANSTFNIDVALNQNWDKIDLIIGLLSTLPTSDKSSIVAALTETYNKIPTKTSSLTNDSGYLTSAPVQSVNGKTGTVSLTNTDVGAAATNHGNHVPTTQTANNTVFLRNDNSWQTVTPSNIGAAATSHTHTKSQITDFPSSLPANGGTSTNVTGGTVSGMTNVRIPAAQPGTLSDGDIWVV